jgi:L-seryl-tRNA(Ser) seleniumtransferase
MNNHHQLRALPNMQRLLETAAIDALCQQYSHQETVTALRLRIDVVRVQIQENGESALPDFESHEFSEAIRSEILRGRERSLKSVVNATGIVLHTNLGRAPIAEEAIEAIKEAALGYSNLELDLDTGKRGSRYVHVEGLLKKITGAEAAVVVNNCAAAVLLSLNTLANKKKVLVSRGELIEIGGAFRMPDVIKASGAKMTEVGTTNKTRIADYEKAIRKKTRVILRNHTSNYKVVGFTENAKTKELVELAHSNDLFMIEDLGSGSLTDLAPFGVADERSVQKIVADGVDAVMFSGDKLLGGPQAGIIVGKANVIEKMKKNPLLRALRIDKLSLAALEATLALYLHPELASQRVPILQMISADQDSIKRRAADLLQKIQTLESINAWVEDGTSFIGGGSAPMIELPTSVIKIECKKYSAEKAAEVFRAHKPAIIGRIADNTMVLDLRTVFPHQIDHLQSAIESLA